MARSAIVHCDQLGSSFIRFNNNISMGSYLAQLCVFYAPLRFVVCIVFLTIQSVVQLVELLADLNSEANSKLNDMYNSTSSYT